LVYGLRIARLGSLAGWAASGEGGARALGALDKAFALDGELNGAGEGSI